MSAPKHTAGPWGTGVTFLRHCVASANGLPIMAGDLVVARMPIKADRAMDQKWADARLIAAAPDLLEALTKATTQIVVWRSINGDMVGALAELEDECRTAIAKATGEGA